MRIRSRVATVMRYIGWTLATLVAIFLIGRAAVEVVTLDPGHPESYRQSWGGPHYIGVLTVHALPGMLALIAVVVLSARHISKRKSLHDITEDLPGT